MFIDSQLLINKNKFKGIEKFILCPICEGIVNIPYECLECQNNFCKNCIEKWKLKNNNCPFRCKEFNLIHNRFLENILSELLKFRCDKECDEIINYKDINKHYNGECKNIVNYDYKEKFEEISLEFTKLTVKYENLIESNKDLKEKTNEAIREKNNILERFDSIKNQKILYKNELEKLNKEKKMSNKISNKISNDINKDLKSLNSELYSKIDKLNNTIKLINKENSELKFNNKELKKENLKLKELLENDYYEEDYDDENDFSVNKK
jgi:anti-sigma regulatory factor (Ser/Thr protein kinase)